MKRLLITGGSGYLGSHLVKAASAWEAYPTCFSRPAPRGLALDLRDGEAVRRVLHDLRPDAILHTACSNQTADQVRAIVPAARQLALAARELDIRLVHLSSDMVFDGKHAPYADEAPPSPITEYGRAKAEAEAIVADFYPAAAIVRPSLIWGLDPLDHQTRWLVEGAQRGERITLFTDEIRCPVHVHDLCAALLELAARPGLHGPLNLAGPQPLNRWDFGMKLLGALGLTPGPNVVRGSAPEPGLVRPRNLTLLSVRARQLLRAPLRAVDDVLTLERNLA